MILGLYMRTCIKMRVFLEYVQLYMMHMCLIPIHNVEHQLNAGDSQTTRLKRTIKLYQTHQIVGAPGRTQHKMHIYINPQIYNMNRI